MARILRGCGSSGDIVAANSETIAASASPACTELLEAGYPLLYQVTQTRAIVSAEPTLIAIDNKYNKSNEGELKLHTEAWPHLQALLGSRFQGSPMRSESKLRKQRKIYISGWKITRGNSVSSTVIHQIATSRRVSKELELLMRLVIRLNRGIGAFAMCLHLTESGMAIAPAVSGFSNAAIHGDSFIAGKPNLWY